MDPPLPSELEEAIDYAEIDKYNPYRIVIHFKGGVKRGIIDNSFDYVPDESLIPGNKVLPNIASTTDENLQSIISTQTFPATTVKNKKVLILGPAAYESDDYGKAQLFVNLVSAFEAKGFEVTTSSIKNYVLSNEIPDPNTNYDEDVIFYRIDELHGLNFECQIIPGAEERVTWPQDFEDLDQYGVVIVVTHGFSAGIMCCPYYIGDSHKSVKKLHDWLVDNPGDWMINYQSIASLHKDPVNFVWDYYSYYAIVTLTPEFFTKRNFNFDGSIIYMNVCYSYEFQNDNQTIPQAKVYLSYERGVQVEDSPKLGYDFFITMLGSIYPPEHCRQAFLKVKTRYQGRTALNPKLNTGPNNENDHTYLPSDVDVIVNEE